MFNAKKVLPKTKEDVELLHKAMKAIKVKSCFRRK